VIGLYNKNLPLFAESRAIVPLDDMLEKFGIGESHYASAAWRLCRVSPRGADNTPGNAQLFGAPNTCSTMALYMNKRALIEAGYDPEVAPTSISQLDAMAEDLYIIDASKAGAARFTRLGFTPSEPGWWPHAWAPHFGGSLYDHASDRATCASDACVRAYEWVQTFPDRLGVQDVMGFQSGMGSYNSAEQPLLAGRVAMCLHGPFLVNVIKQFSPSFEFTVAPFPCEWRSDANTPPTGLMECDVLVIPSASKHIAEAAEFIAFTQQREHAEELCIAHAKPSPLAGCSDDYYERHPHPAIRVHEQIARSERAFGYPSTRVWNEYEDLFRRGFERDIWQLSRPAREALAAIERDAQAAIDLAKDRRRLRA
jgi:multiple sugar transport system substrate-binding protein